MLNKLREIHTNYQFFVVFWEPFADTILLERNKLFFFQTKNLQSSKFVQSGYHDPVLPSLIVWSLVNNYKIVFC